MIPGSVRGGEQPRLAGGAFHLPSDRGEWLLLLHADGTARPSNIPAESGQDPGEHECPEVPLLTRHLDRTDRPSLRAVLLVAVALAIWRRETYC